MKLGVEFTRIPSAFPPDLDVILLPRRDTWGRVRDIPRVPSLRASVSVFAATALVRRDPRYVARSREGLPALPGPANPRDGLAWGWVCPRHPTYLEEHVIPVLVDLPVPVLFQDLQYPAENYCFCPRCQEAYREAPVASVRRETLNRALHTLIAHLPAPTSPWVTLHPAPCTLSERFGVVPEDWLDRVEAFVVPIYDLDYRLTYWMDDILFGMTRRFPGRIWVQLYGIEPSTEGLVRALVCASRHPIEGILFYVQDLHRLRRTGELLLQDPRTRRASPSLLQLAERLIHL